MSRLKHTLCILSVTKRCINQCSLFHKSSLAPIRRLPVEILGLIFEVACALLPLAQALHPHFLQLYRLVCLSTPSIWSNITARHTSSDSSNIVARINHYQSMSLNHALTFDLTAMIDKAIQKQISTVRFTMNGRARVIYNTLTFRSPSLNPIITNPSFSFSRLATLEIILTPDSKLPAAQLLDDLLNCLISKPDPPPITSLSLRYVPFSDADVISVLDHIPLLRKVSIIEPDREQRSKHLPVITEGFVNYLREHPVLESIELVLIAARPIFLKESGVMDMLEHRATLGLLNEVTLGIRHGTEMNAQILERLKRLREQGIVATQW
ncbi:hypothetical protein F5146DRAFT_1120025 [Armillaria mellea]|nr:hypothetical protein F5146DRAFT_1120025 [Armillaria mellea]